MYHDIIRGWRVAMLTFYNQPSYFYYEGEDPPVDDDPPVPIPAPTPTPTTTFTQDDVNRFLADERRKAQKQNEKTIKELESLRKTSQLTVEEKEKLETRIEDLKNEYLSKEEIAQKERKKLSEKEKKEKEELISDRDKWKNMYESSTIDREIIDAAGSDVFNASQVLRILRPDTRLTEELNDDGQPTGRLIPKVKFAGKDKDGKHVVLDLTVTEAIKQMKEMQEDYGNLFRSGANGGLGGTNTNVSRGTNGPPLNDTAAYREWRKSEMQGKR